MLIAVSSRATGSLTHLRHDVPAESRLMSSDKGPYWAAGAAVAHHPGRTGRSAAGQVTLATGAFSHVVRRLRVFITDLSSVDAVSTSRSSAPAR